MQNRDELLKQAGEVCRLLKEYENDKVEDILSALEVADICYVLNELPPDSRPDALLLLNKQLARAVISSQHDYAEDSFFRMMRSADISRMLEPLYDEDSDIASVLPAPILQRMLAKGTNAVREAIKSSMHQMLLNKQLPSLRVILTELNPVDIAAMIEDFEIDWVMKIFRTLPKDLASDVFVYLPQDCTQAMLSRMSDAEAGRLIDDLYADDAADLLEEMPSNVVKKLLSNTMSDTRAAVNHLLQYKEDSAGSIMTVEFVDLKENYTVRQSIERIRKNGIDKETINNCYVLDSARRLLGTVTLRKLLLSQPDDKIGDIMEDNVIMVHTNTDQEEVAALFTKYDFNAMPVCDSEDRLVGIVTVDDIVDIIQDEAEEDFSKMAAMAPLEDEYMKTSAWTHAKSRILWLLFLMISATFTGLAINGFEAQLTTFLYSFTPLIMGTAGNCGSQSSTTVIRALALGEISSKDYIKVSWKEAQIALICSSILAAANTVRIIIMYWWTDYNVDFAVLKAALILGIVLILIVLFAQTIGSLLPILAKKLHVDPALMSAPVISTIMDTLSILIYCAVIIAVSAMFSWTWVV